MKLTERLGQRTNAPATAVNDRTSNAVWMMVYCQVQSPVRWRTLMLWDLRDALIWKVHRR